MELEFITKPRREASVQISRFASSIGIVSFSAGFVVASVG
jgi:hypothetical protein